MLPAKCTFFSIHNPYLYLFSIIAFVTSYTWCSWECSMRFHKFCCWYFSHLKEKNHILQKLHIVWFTCPGNLVSKHCLSCLWIASGGKPQTSRCVDIVRRDSVLITHGKAIVEKFSQLTSFQSINILCVHSQEQSLVME